MAWTASQEPRARQGCKDHRGMMGKMGVMGETAGMVHQGHRVRKDLMEEMGLPGSKDRQGRKGWTAKWVLEECQGGMARTAEMASMVNLVFKGHQGFKDRRGTMGRMAWMGPRVRGGQWVRREMQ